MTSDRRAARMQEVLEMRLGIVRCALEAVYHRHNVSAILRSCDAFGVHRVHLVGSDRTRPSRGAARGAERWLELHHHHDASDALAALHTAGVDVWVADLTDGPSVGPGTLPLDRPVCLWFGAELAGVSLEARAAARGVLTVPMVGMAQSLNVSVAAALGLGPLAERARALGASGRLTPAEREATLERWKERDRRAIAAAHVEG